MASTATCDMSALAEEMMMSDGPCGCAAEELPTDSHLFRGILIAIPAGLLAWAGLLRIAGEVLHRL